jgi:N-acetylneuraminic acid mutarotase
MKTLVATLLFTLGLICSDALVGQVPSLLDYQGGVALGGTAFHGLGYFKFAFVGREGTQTFWSNDGTSTGGGQPAHGLPLVVYHGSYEVGLGDTTLPNMRPVPPAVFAHPDVHLRVWFSEDNVTFQRVEPDTPMTAVAYAMMAAAVPDGAITSAKLAEGAVTAGKLGANAVTGANLAPGSVGAPHLGPNAAALNLQGSGGLIMSDQSEATNLISAGFTKIGTVQVDSDQWTTFNSFNPSPRTNAVAAWVGNQFMIWGGVSGGRQFTDGARYNPSAETWTAVAPVTPPLAQGDARGIWTGGELLLLSKSTATQARRYNPSNDTWRPISHTNAPTVTDSTVLLWAGAEALVWDPQRQGRRYQPLTDTWQFMAQTNLLSTLNSYAGVWTGEEMLLWGCSTSGPRGACYRPMSNTWRPISNTNAPAARYYFTAVYTGPDVIVWGGQSGSTTTSTRLNSGAIYNLATDTWRPMNTNNVLARAQHTAYWTGTEMLVWGGNTVTTASGVTRVTYVDGGARYNPKTDTWRPLSARGMPATPAFAMTAWNGTELYVWGGCGYLGDGQATGPVENAGWRYQVATDTWLPLVGAPVPRGGHTAVWTGTDLIVWGGTTSSGISGVPSPSYLVNSGARFNPSNGRWYPVASASAPTPRLNHRAVWTGREMLVWGGEGLIGDRARVGMLNSGGCYDLATDTWRAMDTNGAPLARADHSMVWAGSELLVFGGRTNYNDMLGRYTVNTGGRYQPQTDSWTTMTTKQAPSPRQNHATVWTGTEMIVWGGMGQFVTNGQTTLGTLATGARYNPVLNTWLPVSSAPLGITGVVAAVWADQTMLTWNPVKGSGARYDPVSDTWKTIATGGPRVSPATSVGAVWTGSEMLVWFGPDTRSSTRYSPLTDTWTRVASTGAPRFSLVPASAWTGKGLLLHGRLSSDLPTNAVHYYTLNRPLYLYRHP